MRVVKKSYLLDTNFIISLISSDDFEYESAVEIWNEISSNSRLLISFDVYMELRVGEVFNKLPRTFELSKFLNDYQVEIIQVNDVWFIERALNYCREGIRTADLSIFATAIQESANLVTFDRKLGKYFNSYLDSFK